MPYISPISPLYLPYISPATPPRAGLPSGTLTLPLTLPLPLSLSLSLSLSLPLTLILSLSLTLPLTPHPIPDQVSFWDAHAPHIAGGTRTTVAAPLDIIPVYLRA